MKVRAKETNPKILGFTKSNGLKLILRKTMETQCFANGEAGEFRRREGNENAKPIVIHGSIFTQRSNHLYLGGPILNMEDKAHSQSGEEKWGLRHGRCRILNFNVMLKPNLCHEKSKKSGEGRRLGLIGVSLYQYTFLFN